TGACWTDGATIDVTTWRLTPGNQGAAINDLQRHLRGWIRDGKPDLIAFEDASYGSHNRSTQAFHNALRGGIVAVAAEFGLEHWAYNPSSIKAQTCSNGRATKDQMIRAVERLYRVKCSNSDEADAVAIAMLAVKGIKPVGMMKQETKRRVKRAAK